MDLRHLFVLFGALVGAGCGDVEFPATVVDEPSGPGPWIVYEPGSLDLSTRGPLYAARTDSLRSPHLLTEPDQLVFEFAWSPRGTAVAYSTSSDSGDMHLWVATVDETGWQPPQLLRSYKDYPSKFHGPGELVWSPDGSLLLVLEQDGMYSDSVALARAAADGTYVLTDVTQTTESNHFQTWGWAESSRRFFFETSAHVWVGDVTVTDGAATITAEPLELPEPDRAIKGSALSPDGQRLVVELAMEPGSRSWLIDLDQPGRPSAPLVPFEGDPGDVHSFVGHAQWSPDGTRLIYRVKVGALRLWTALDVLSGQTYALGALEPLAWVPGQPASWVVHKPNGDIVLFDLADLSEGPQPVVLSSTPSTPSLSAAPDGLWLGHASKDESGDDLWWLQLDSGTEAVHQETDLLAGMSSIALRGASWAPSGDHVLLKATCSECGGSRVHLLRLSESEATESKVYAPADLIRDSPERSSWSGDSTRFALLGEEGLQVVWLEQSVVGAPLPVTNTTREATFAWQP